MPCTEKSAAYLCQLSGVDNVLLRAEIVIRRRASFGIECFPHAVKDESGFSIGKTSILETRAGPLVFHRTTMMLIVALEVCRCNSSTGPFDEPI